jgi:CheY-like chemotaxis protein
MGKSITEILVVDPNKVVAKMVGNTLTDQVNGAHVDFAVNVWELKRRLKDKKYDLVIADLSIGMDGDEMAEELKRTAPAASMVYWSFQSLSEKKNAKSLTKVACQRVMQKPTSKAEFKAMLPGLLLMLG